MIVRALDSIGDFTFGKGLNDYKSANNAVAQNLQTRLNSFLGDCFFDQGAGIDWFNLLGAKDQLSLNLAVSAVILNTADVLSMNQLSINLSRARVLSISYSVSTSFGSVSQSVAVTI